MSGCAAAFPALATGGASLGLELDGLQRERLIRYCDLLLETNRHINLTAIRTPEGVMRTLFLDALTLTLAMPDRMRSATALRAVDVGSGAGLPGLPLKIVYPGWSVMLIESVGKKARFIERVAEALELDGVTVLSRRAEEVGADRAWRDAADLGLARAVAALPTLLELLAPLVKTGGLLLLPKSGEVEAEIDAAAAASQRLLLRLERVVPVPEDLGLGTEHAIVVYEKTGPTPPGYPRRVGLARSHPIGS